MEAALSKGRALPQWYLDEPPAQPFDHFYLRSFWDLDSTRRYDRGPIPWDAAVNYGYHAGLDGDIVDAFVILIRAMDTNYLAWAADEAERRTARNKTADRQRKRDH